MDRYVPVRPEIFRTGDIVEACVGFVCVPIRDKHYMMTPQLRALTLLNSEDQEVGQILKN